MLSFQIFAQTLALKPGLGDLAVILVYGRRVKLSKAALIFSDYDGKKFRAICFFSGASDSMIAFA
jgi:hypothetical protein